MYVHEGGRERRFTYIADCTYLHHTCTHILQNTHSTNSPPHKFTHIVQHTLLPNVTVSDPPQSQVVSGGSHQIWELTGLESRGHNRYMYMYSYTHSVPKDSCSRSRIHFDISCCKMYM